MSFKKILDNLVLRSGAVGAVMVAGDGEVVEASEVAVSGVNSAWSGGDGPLELDLVGAHNAVVLDLLKEVAAESPELGRVESVMVSTGSARLALTVLKEGYMLVAIMDRGTRSAKVLFESKCAVKRIEAEMG
jgi:predicted regulator of Ras-like GTPase activity (Roadblock/LC7/MglB family)